LRSSSTTGKRKTSVDPSKPVSRLFFFVLHIAFSTGIKKPHTLLASPSRTQVFLCTRVETHTQKYTPALLTHAIHKCGCELLCVSVIALRLFDQSPTVFVAQSSLFSVFSLISFYGSSDFVSLAFSLRGELR
jgi:hypothetical protein